MRKALVICIIVSFLIAFASFLLANVTGILEKIRYVEYVPHKYRSDW